jgi:lysophospholipase
MMPPASSFRESTFDRRAYPDALAFSEWKAADGWEHRVYRWAPIASRPPRGSMIFQSGRADFIEKYLEVCNHWHRAGWLVEGFDWRGQGGSGRLDPANPADDRISFDPLIDDLAEYVADWQRRTPPPHVLVAHSMGGHVALRMLAERGVRLDALALVAPMLALNTAPLPRSVARIVVRAMIAAGRGARAVSGELVDGPRRQTRLTSDRMRFADSQWWKREKPELGSGPPTWHFLAAALAAADRISGDDLESVKTPVLLLAAGRDRLVDGRSILRAAARLPDAETSLFPAAVHELLREADVYRLPALAAIDDFLARKAPPR